MTAYILCTDHIPQLSHGPYWTLAPSNFQKDSSTQNFPSTAMALTPQPQSIFPTWPKNHQVQTSIGQQYDSPLCSSSGTPPSSQSATSTLAASSASAFLATSCSFFSHRDSSSHSASLTIRSASMHTSKACWSFWAPSCLDSKSSATVLGMRTFHAMYVEIGLGGIMKQKEEFSFSPQQPPPLYPSGPLSTLISDFNSGSAESFQNMSCYWPLAPCLRTSG